MIMPKTQINRSNALTYLFIKINQMNRAKIIR
jgi:hypothetical protein